MSRIRPADQLAITQRADEAGERVHPKPAEAARQQQADDDENRNRRVGHHMDQGRAHVVVAMQEPRGMSGLGEAALRGLAAEAHDASKSCGSGISSADSR